MRRLLRSSSPTTPGPGGGATAIGTAADAAGTAAAAVAGTAGAAGAAAAATRLRGGGAAGDASPSWPRRRGSAVAGPGGASAPDAPGAWPCATCHRTRVSRHPPPARAASHMSAVRGTGARQCPRPGSRRCRPRRPVRASGIAPHARTVRNASIGVRRTARGAHLGPQVLEDIAAVRQRLPRPTRFSAGTQVMVRGTGRAHLGGGGRPGSLQRRRRVVVVVATALVRHCVGRDAVGHWWVKPKASYAGESQKSARCHSLQRRGPQARAFSRLRARTCAPVVCERWRRS
jgi:hypothetical protein